MNLNLARRCWKRWAGPKERYDLKENCLAEGRKTARGFSISMFKMTMFYLIYSLKCTKNLSNVKYLQFVTKVLSCLGLSCFSRFL